MSKESYWRMRRAAKVVYDTRQKKVSAQDMRVLSGGMYTAAAMIFVFGVCMCNFEFLAIAGALTMLGKIF